MVAEINNDPNSLSPKLFLIHYCLNQTCELNLKSLASMVADISRASRDFWDAPLAQPMLLPQKLLGHAIWNMMHLPSV